LQEISSSPISFNLFTFLNERPPRSLVMSSQQHIPMTGPTFILPHIRPHPPHEQFVVQEPAYSFFPAKPEHVHGPLPSISELLASASVGPSKLPGPSSMTSRSSSPINPSSGLDFPTSSLSSPQMIAFPESRLSDGEYLLPQIPPGYEAPRTASPQSYEMARSSSPNYDPQRSLSPRNSTSLGATDSIDGLAGSFSSPKTGVRDHREGDLATAMILMGIQAKSDPAFPFRKKRQRSSPAQLNVLEEHFLLNPMPSHISRVELALRLNMTPRRIQVWFQNKRAKVRRAIRNGEEVNVSLPESDSDD